MRCEQVRENIALFELGELEGRSARQVEAHLADCAACRQAQAGHRDLAALLADYAPPALPTGFGAELRQRLQSEPPRRASDAPAEAASEHVWRRYGRAAALVAAGVVVGALGLWLARPAPPAPVKRAPVASAPAPLRLHTGEVAVVTLVVHAKRQYAHADLEVVLPDGLALVGEGLGTYAEKQLRWTDRLHPGENEIRVPVMARHSGTWQVVARVRAGALRTRASARLVVTKS